VNKYLLTIPVDSWQIAQLLGSETNWKILETLRDVGAQGLTAEEISKRINVPKSTIYNVLSKLQAGSWVESGVRRPQWGRPSKEVKQRLGGKPTRIFVGNVLWGDNEFDEEFEASLVRLLEELEKDMDELKQKWLSILEKIVSTYERDEKLRKFFPQDSIHEECGWSHEGEEFLYASSLEVLGKILSDEDYYELARRHKFMK